MQMRYLAALHTDGVRTRLTGMKSNSMAKRVQLLFYHRDADCFFIAQPGCGLGLTCRFGIIAALSPRAIMPAIYGII
ncbi:hypothetical protein BSP75_15745 [Aeromonas sp. YN13HZO-058]|nr:hypothetical protein BSP75_15745 [Aeromonas sp. YN13HZO-058]